MFKMKQGEKCEPSVPKATVPGGSKQSSGATKHARMSQASKVEGNQNSPKGMPTCH